MAAKVIQQKSFVGGWTRTNWIIKCGRQTEVSEEWSWIKSQKKKVQGQVWNQIKIHKYKTVIDVLLHSSLEGT